MVCLNLDIIYPAYLRYRYGVIEKRLELSYLMDMVSFHSKSLMDFAMNCKTTDWGRVVVNFDMQDVEALLEMEVYKGNLVRKKDKLGNYEYTYNIKEKGLDYLSELIGNLTDELPYYHPYVLYSFDLQESITSEEIEDFRCFA